MGIGEPDYPAKLCGWAQAPAQLWWRGRWRPAARAVAVVGARAASGNGQDFAAELAGLLAQSSVDVISGGAFGIDAAAHRGALANEGKTVAVFGSGIDIFYPERHRRLFERIVAMDGALLSSFQPGQLPSRWTFPARNQLVAALADWVVVVEASAHSGALYTTQAAQRLGRPIAARPGSPGTEALLRCGAAAIHHPIDFVEWMLRGKRVAPTIGCPHPLFGLLDGTPRDVDELSQRASLPFAEASRLLADWECEGWVTRLAGGRFRRSDFVE